MQIGAKYNIFLKYEKTQTFQKKMTKTAEERLQNVGGGSFVKKKNWTNPQMSSTIPPTWVQRQKQL